MSAELTTRTGARPTRALSSRAATERLARGRANHLIAFLGHALIYLATCFMLLVSAGFFTAVVVGAAWFILLSAHGFFFVIAPRLRSAWVEREVAQRTLNSGEQPELLEGRHTQSLVELSAAIAHEIRNPVAAAKSLLQQIRRIRVLGKRRNTSRSRWPSSSASSARCRTCCATRGTKT